VAKALKKSPGERYDSVSAFAEDLQRYLKQEPILARPDAIAYRVGKFVRRRRQSLTAALFVSLTAAGAMIASWTYSPRTQAPELKQQRLTANDDTLPVLNAAVSPDGRYLSYSDQRGIHLQLVETGEIQRLPSLAEIAPERARWTVGGWYPDSKRFIAAAAASGKPASLWAVPIHDGKPEKLGDFDGMQGAGSISPDGAHIAFASNQTAIGAHEIWLMGAGGESPHKILTAGFKAGFGMIAWSPGGDRLAFAEARPVGDDVELSIRSCDIHGANQTTIVREDALSAFAWTAQNRLLYARSTRTGAGQFGELWEVNVDQLGGRRGDARRLTDWAGFAIRNLNATANGKRVAFVRRTFHSSVYAGDLSGNGNRFANWREARKDDNTNVAISWTPDSRAIFFSSQRASTRQVYRQTLDSDLPAEPVTASLDTNFYIARPSPDETSMIFEGQPSGSRQFALYRASIAGGEPRMMYPIQSFAHFWCANKTAGFCVVGYAVAAESSLVISKFTLTDPPGKEALRIPLEPGTDGGVGLDYRWQLSPDGLHIAILKKGGNQIRVFSMNGSSRSLTLASYPDLLDLAWATDSQSLFVSAPGPEGITLLHVGPSGAVQRLWLQPGATWLWPIPSPDGRHIAFGYEHAEANVWMFSNF
jgi:Tol biopolymer transport system component